MADKKFLDAMKNKFSEDPTDKEPLSITWAVGNNLKEKAHS